MIDLRERANAVVATIEDCETLDAIAAPVARCVQRFTTQDDIKNTLSGTWLGHQLHPVLTDLPIGAWTMATALDLIGGETSATATRHLVGLGVLAAIPTAATGASDWVDTYGPEQRIGLAHAAANIAATALQAASWVARKRNCHRTGFLLSAAGLGLVMGAGYLGGHLTLMRGVGVNHTAFESAASKWTDVGDVASLQPDTPTRVEAKGVPVVLVQHNGTVHALSATCCHAGGPLDEGTVEGGCIRCPWHGSVFQLADGHVVRGPAANDQPLWEVKIDDDRILIRAMAA